MSLAFIQYVMDDLMYWPPNYDFSPQKKEPYPAYVQGTPNQKICYLTARGIVGCMIRNHPRFGRWMDRVLEEHDRVVSGSVAPISRANFCRTLVVSASMSPSEIGLLALACQNAWPASTTCRGEGVM